MRALIVVAAWVLCGSLLVGATFLPWAGSGPLSQSTPVDLAGLVRSGVLTSVPGWLPWVVVLLPLTGAALVALAAVARAKWARIGLWLVGGLTWFGLMREATAGDVARWSQGAWLGAVSLLIGLGALLTESRRRTTT